MDVDPLADTVPPRHAIESDEEEDEYNPLSAGALTDRATSIPKCTLLGSVEERRPLIIASGTCGSTWARGANLGQQIGAINVDDVQVGLIFSLPWTTKSHALVSEATTTLPAWAMSSYAQCVLDNLKPSKIVLLDTYGTCSYVSQDYIPAHEAPVRYLSSENYDPNFSNMAAFEPPNMLSSTTAAILVAQKFISPTEATGTITSCLAILLPSSSIRPPPPHRMPPSHPPRFDEQWPLSTLLSVHGVLLKFVGEQIYETSSWQQKEPRGKETQEPGRRNTEIGEGGMYI